MKVCILTLGCKVNVYESEVIKSLFIDNNDVIVKEEENPDIIVINTCTVTNQSDAKSRKIIRSAKRKNPNAIIVVCGCSSQQYQEELKVLGIDVLIGNKDKTKIVDYVKEFLINKEAIISFYDLQKTEFEDMKINNFEGRTRAFVKIQDGCNNYCSYCIIPYIRGKQRNKDINIAYEEIKELVSNGFKEIVLTGIHTGSYGIGQDYNLISLIRKISDISELKRIRISSIEITEINEEFLNELKINDKICDHLHIPLQSGANAVLKLMNRKYNFEEYQKIINKIRKIRPEINITTDIIVGFPSETLEDFNETIKNARKIGFGKIHVFPYSKRNGTLASKIENLVSEKEKKDRCNQLLVLSDELENQYYQKFKEKILGVLIEDVKDGISYGHTSNYIKIIVPEELNQNQEYDVLINSVDNLVVKGIVNNFNK